MSFLENSNFQLEFGVCMLKNYLTLEMRGGLLKREKSQVLCPVVFPQMAGPETAGREV